MNKPVFRVVGLDHATCESEYCGTETTTRPSSRDALIAGFSGPSRSLPSTVTVRLRDMLPTLHRSSSAGLAWVSDFADDPVVITKDLYEVLITYERQKKAA